MKTVLGISNVDGKFQMYSYITGGNPVMAGDDVLFNDMLGNTLAVNGQPVQMTAFGETADPRAFFTGKPNIEELGYAFLFRNYEDIRCRPVLHTIHRESEDFNIKVRTMIRQAYGFLDEEYMRLKIFDLPNKHINDGI